MQSTYGSFPIRRNSYRPAGSVFSPTIKSNGICALVLVPGNCAEAVATAPTAKMDRAKIVLRIFNRMTISPLWVSDRSESPSGLFVGSQPSPAASPLNEELLRQFIVTAKRFLLLRGLGPLQRTFQSGSRLKEGLETTEFISEPILIPLGPE